MQAKKNSSYVNRDRSRKSKELTRDRHNKKKIDNVTVVGVQRICACEKQREREREEPKRRKTKNVAMTSSTIFC